MSESYRGLPDEDYRFTLGTTRGSIDEFFAPTAENDEILRERRHWFQTTPELYAGLLPEGEPIADEFCRHATRWIGADFLATSHHSDSLGRLIEVSGYLEPDIVLIKEDDQHRPITVGGCVCFPSSWSLPEKLGLSVAGVHAVVPGMNAALESRVDKLLRALKPGEGWIRSNWSAEESAARNQHPRQLTPDMTSPADPERVWLRREHQLLFRLPETGGIVFGIRLEMTSLRDILSDPEMARRWARGLRTIPADLLAYKGLLPVRGDLISLLTNLES